MVFSNKWTQYKHINNHTLQTFISILEDLALYYAKFKFSHFNGCKVLPHCTGVTHSFLSCLLMSTGDFSNLSAVTMACSSHLLSLLWQFSPQASFTFIIEEIKIKSCPYSLLKEEPGEKQGNQALGEGGLQAAASLPGLTWPLPSSPPSHLHQGLGFFESDSGSPASLKLSMIPGQLQVPDLSAFTSQELALQV